MKDKDDFTLKLSQSKQIDILKSYEIDSQRLIAAIQIVLQKRKFRTEEKNDTVHFNYSPRYTTHSGDNEMQGMKIFRHGVIELNKISNEKIEFKSQINLGSLIFMAALSCIFSCLIGLLSSTTNGKIGFVIFGLALFGLIMVIGRNTIKDNISSIIRDVVKNVA